MTNTGKFTELLLKKAWAHVPPESAIVDVVESNSLHENWLLLSNCIDTHVNLQSLDGMVPACRESEQKQAGCYKKKIKQHQDNVNRNNIDISGIIDIKCDIGIQCKECKSNDVQYVLIANRSADEGMSADCVCRQCKGRFRIRV